MAYKVLVSRVTGDDTFPPEEEEVSPSSPVTSSKYTCNKCTRPQLSDVQTNTDVKYCICGGLLTPIGVIGQAIQTVCALLAPPKKEHVQSVPATIENIRIGSTVCRKIKMHQFGVVTNITYGWGRVKYITQVWVKWHAKPEATPYMPIDLLVITVH